jgi:sec-independent protein translocase protein TatB
LFDVSSPELLLLGAVAIAVIPPKDLPRAMRFVGQWVGKARGMARHFRSGLDEMIRQAELEEIEKKWREENERIMREHPLHDAIEHPPEPVMTALRGPQADPTNDMNIEPAPAEASAEAAPSEPAQPLADTLPAPETASETSSGPAPKQPRVAKPAAEQVDEGPELPFDLPPQS